MCNVTNNDGRGLLPRGYRSIKCAQKLLRVLAKAKTLLASTHTNEQRTRVLQNALKRADETCPNMRTLETTCLTRFDSLKVLIGPYKQIKEEQKSMEGDFKVTTLRQSVRMQGLAASRFQLFYTGAQADGIVTVVGLPQTFESWASFKQAAGGHVCHIIDPNVLRLHPHATEEEEEKAVMENLYGEGASAAGYHGARIEATIYPWVQSGYTSPAVTERLWQRFVHACKELEQTWGDAGLGPALSCPVADSWSC